MDTRGQQQAMLKKNSDPDNQFWRDKALSDPGPKFGHKSKQVFVPHLSPFYMLSPFLCDAYEIIFVCVFG